MNRKSIKSSYESTTMRAFAPWHAGLVLKNCCCLCGQKILEVKQPVLVDNNTSRVKVRVMHLIFFLLAGGGAGGAGDNPCVQGSLMVIPEVRERVRCGPATGNLSSR